MKILLPKRIRYSHNSRQKGQALLIVLLIMAVALTVVLSSVSRSVTDVSVSSVEEDSLRAFSAAEAGVEEALLSGTLGSDSVPVTVDTTNPSASETYQRSIQIPDNPNNQYTYPDQLLSGETATFWLVSKDEDGNLKCDPGNGYPCYTNNAFEICWDSATATGIGPAVEIALYYDNSAASLSTSANDYSNVKVYRYAYDPYSYRANNTTHFTVLPNDTQHRCDFGNLRYSTGSNGSSILSYPTALSCPGGTACVLAIAVRALYTGSSKPVGLKVYPSGTSSLPGQGVEIESTGQAGESSRKVNVFRSYSEAPSMFNTSIFSRNNLGL